MRPSPAATALRYVLDEDLRSGSLWKAILQHNAGGLDLIDATRVGDPPDLPLGTLDPDVLVWAEREGRILVSNDRTTMPGHLAAHLRAGRRSPGVLIVRAGHSIPVLVATLALEAHTASPSLFADRYDFIP